MATDQLMQQLKTDITKLQQAFMVVSARRQEYVITAIVTREDGKVFPENLVTAFDSARSAVIRAAIDLDKVMAALKAEDNAAYLKVIGAFNDKMATVPMARTSSESIEVILADALPSFPRELLNLKNSPAVNQAIQIEKANYAIATNGLNGLGFIAALVAPIGAACATAAAATALTGIGPVVVGIGCALLIAAVVIGTLYLVYKTASQLPRLVMGFSPQASASLAEAERLEAAAKLVEASGNLSSEAKKTLIERLTPPPKPDSVPWALIGLVAVGALVAWAATRKSQPIIVTTPAA